MRTRKRIDAPRLSTVEGAVVYDLPGYVWAMVLTGVIGIAATTALVLYRGGVAAGLSRRTAISTAVTAYTLLGAWLVASAVLAGVGTYVPDSGRTRPWLAVAFTGVLVSTLLSTRIPPLSRILAHPATLPLLALPHVWRVAGIMFLTVMALGHLPAVFALPAGLGDIAIGLAAPFIARRLARGSRRGAVRFHLLGILDLVVALAIGFLAGLGPYRPFEITPSTEPLGLLPLVLVPTVAVPVTIALHIVSLRRLRDAARSGGDRAGQLLPAAG
jgi:hypothetical protein